MSASTITSTANDFTTFFKATIMTSKTSAQSTWSADMTVKG